MAARKPRKPADRLALIGAGRMGGAMLHGWLDAKLFKPANVFVFEPAADDNLVALAEERGFSLNADLDVIAKKGVTRVVLAVKPQVMADVLPLYAALWSDQDALPLTRSDQGRFHRISVARANSSSWSAVNR